MRELQTLQAKFKLIQETDWQKLAATINHPDPAVREAVAQGVAALKANVRSILEGLDHVTSPNKGGEGYRASGAIDTTPEVQEQSVLSYDQLRALLESQKITLPVSDNAKKRYRAAKVRENRGSITWFDKLRFGKSRLEVPEDPWEVYIGLHEMELRRLPGYGKDFTLDRSRIVFDGDQKKLIYALENGLVEDVLVKVYPLDPNPNYMDKFEYEWMLDNLSHKDIDFFNNVGANPISKSIRKMRDVVGSHQLSFVSSFKPNSPVRNLNVPIKERIKQVGRYLDITEALFYLYVLRGCEKDAEFMVQTERIMYPGSPPKDEYPFHFEKFFNHVTSRIGILKDPEGVKFII